MERLGTASFPKNRSHGLAAQIRTSLGVVTLPNLIFNVKSLQPALWAGLLCALASGCQRRGYTDLYVDAMATEIRDLQDQLYEYDHEYRLLEQELDSLRRQNSSFRSQNQSTSPQSLKNSSPLEFLPKGSSQDPLPAPGKRSEGNQGSSRAPQETLEVPQLSLPPSIQEMEGMRSVPKLVPEEVPPASASPSAPQPDKSAPSTDFDFDVDEIMVPSIKTGAIQPPQMPPRVPGMAPENDLEVGLSQIELPLQLASTPGGQGAKISEATEVVQDKRVVELAFHPILCRTVNLDDDEKDDGVFLVLQPRNRQGQFVPSPAALTIEILDPGRDSATSRIGHWQYSTSEIAGKMQPIGNQQGIHLTLPWNGPNPKADRVVVRATYIYKNGRQVAASKEFFVSGPGSLKTVWAPRAGTKGQPKAPADFDSFAPSGFAVKPAGGQAHVPAGGTTVITTSESSVQPEGRSVVQPIGEFLPPADPPAPLR